MRLLFATVLATLVVASPAFAYEYPGQHPLTDQQNVVLQGALHVGEQFWTARNVHPCPQDQLVIFAAPSLMDTDGYEADARTMLGTCNMWWQDAPLSILRLAARYVDRGFYDELCLTAVHELGHSGGLVHSDDPHSIMNISATIVPYDCRVWSKSMMQAQIRLYRLVRRHKKISR